MLKKLFAVSVVLSSLFLVSCSEDAVDGQSSWLTGLDSGKEQAQTQSKSIMLVVTADDDGYSQTLKNDIFFRHSFVEKYSKNFVLVNFDFSASFINQALEDSNDDVLEMIDSNLKDVSMYGIKMTPTVLILSDMGFPETEILLNSETNSVKAFDSLMKDADSIISHYNDVLAEALSPDTASDAKALAVRTLYDVTDIEKRHMLKPLLDEVLAMENADSHQADFLTSSCDYLALEMLFRGDYKNAASVYENAAETDWLKNDERQNLYYQSGFMLSSCGYTDYDYIKETFEKALDASPDSDNAMAISKMIKIVDERLSDSKENR